MLVVMIFFNFHVKELTFRNTDFNNGLKCVQI